MNDTNLKAGDEIWVAKGLYKPGSTRSATFQLKIGVAVYGGFVGTETLRPQRDWLKNVTTLSGDINGNGFDNYDSYNVVKGADSATLDGFSITGGNANVSSQYDRGGGVYCSNTSPKISNCVITGNRANNYGGGIYCYNSSPVVNSCTIKNNASGCYGGGAANAYGISSFINCVFSENSATSYGGGMYNYSNASPIILNCIFSKNNSPNMNGGGMYNNCSCPTVINCVFRENSTKYGGGMYNYGSSSKPSLTNCTFSKNSATNGSGGGMYNYYSSSPTVVNCILWGDTAGNGAEICNSSANPTFSHCDIQGCMGNGAGWQSTFGTDLGGNIDLNPNFVDAENPAGPDGKFYTNDDGLHLCVFDPRHGDLQIPFNGSCLDSAEGIIAHWTDITGRPRMDVAYIPNNGSGLIPFTDMGAYESPCVWYVKKGSRGKGWSWDFAADDLQEVIKKAKDDDEIWVATGTYKPSKQTDQDDPRSATFFLDKAIAIYGGFDGTEYARHKRNWVANEIILSGEIGKTETDEDNCYHVVQVESDGAILDGVTITGGYALDVDDPDVYKRGWWCNHIRFISQNRKLYHS